jgi:hypothetical protein
MSDLFHKLMTPFKALDAVSTVRDFVVVQLDRAAVPAYYAMKDEWALGYIFGIHDAALRGALIADQAQSLSAITMSFIQLASSVSEGSEAVCRCLKKEHGPMFKAGAEAGGSDYLAFTCKSETPHVALYDHVSEKVR